MAKIGYARVSSTDQNLERQLTKLKETGCETIFTDKMSGATKERPGLKDMLAYIRDRDVVITTELDRLGRNNEELTEIMDIIRQKGASFEALNLPSTAGIQDDNIRRLINTVIIEVYKYVAESERKKIRERQRQGIELAKAEGKYKGRRPAFQKDDRRLLLAFQFYREGKSLREVEALTGIPISTFRRYWKAYGDQKIIE